MRFKKLEYPLVLVPGGHTELVYVPEPGNYKIVSETRDDAVGEAYDKVGVWDVSRPSS